MGHFRKQCISFLVSSECNLKCVYCYMPKWGQNIAPKDRVIDLEFAIAGLKDYLAWSPVPAIRFFAAGEATHQFHRMVEIHDEARKLVGPGLKVELQTNGQFGEEVASWIEDNVHVCWISSDGPPELHDAQRPCLDGSGSSEVVLANVERLARHPSMQLGVRATFMPWFFDRQIEVLEFFRALGVRYVCGAPAYSSTVNPNITVPVLQDFAHHFVPAYYHAQTAGMFYQTHLMVNFDEPVTCYCRACTKPAHPQLTSDGYVSCCDWASFGPEYLPGLLQACIYGKWDPVAKRIDYYPEPEQFIEARNIETLGAGPCKGCPVLEHCAGGCIGKVAVRSGDLHKIDPNWCAAVKHLAKHIPFDTGVYPVRHS